MMHTFCNNHTKWLKQMIIVNTNRLNEHQHKT